MATPQERGLGSASAAPRGCRASSPSTASPAREQRSLSLVGGDMILRVADSSEISAARRAACDLAGKIGLDEELAGRAALLVTEMATNLLKHGGGGEIVIE